MKLRAPRPSAGCRNATRPRWSAACIAGVLACCALLASAQTGKPQAPRGSAVVADGLSWRDLTLAQREALTPLQQQWSRLDAQSRRKWLTLVERFPTMPQAERDRIQARMHDWAALTPQQRGKARLHFREARVLPDADRKAKWQAYQALSPEQKKQLAARATSSRHARHAKPEHRRTTAESALETAAGTPLATAAVAPPPRPVAPTVLQVRPGATTIPVSRLPGRPLLDTAGVSKIVAGPELIDPATLLPRRGPRATAPRSGALRAEDSERWQPRVEQPLEAGMPPVPAATLPVPGAASPRPAP